MIFRRRSSNRAAEPLADALDPEAVLPAYRPAVVDAARARGQFHALVAATSPGPLQDRLRELGSGVDSGVLAVWNAVQQAMRLESVVATLDPERVTAELKRAKRSSEADASVVEALGARFDSTQRLLNALDELRQRIPVLEARLGTAVARAAELTLTSSTSSSAGALDSLGRELDQLVLELEALQAGAEAVC
jgi:hypothetical protein